MLTNAKYSNADIISISGHKSVQSLAVYQRTDQNKKLEMGKTLGDCLTPKQNMKKILPPPEKPALEAPPKLLEITMPSERALTPRENVIPENAIVPFEPTFDDDIPDIDLLSAICDIEEGKENTSNNGTVMEKKLEIQTTVANVVTQMPRNNMFYTSQGP